MWEHLGVWSFSWGCMYTWDVGWMAWGCGTGTCCVPCRLVSKKFSLFSAERLKKESLLCHLPKMYSRDPSGVLQLHIARCAFHSFPCAITTPKIECSSVRSSILSGMYQCSNVTCEHKGVFSCSMLHCDQGKRASAEKALCSPFFSIPFGKLWLWPLHKTLSACAGSSTEGN